MVNVSSTYSVDIDNISILDKYSIASRKIVI